MKNTKKFCMFNKLYTFALNLMYILFTSKNLKKNTTKISDENFYNHLYNYLKHNTIDDSLKNSWRETNLRRTAKFFYLDNNNRILQITKKEIHEVEIGDSLENSKINKTQKSYEKDTQKDKLLIKSDEFREMVKRLHEQHNHKTGETMLHNYFKLYLVCEG